MKKTNWKNRILNTEKGVTLLELTIVLALLTIVTTLIVSFSTLVSNQVKLDNARADFITAASDCKFALQANFAEIDQNGEITFYYTDDPCVIYFKNQNGGEKVFEISSQYPDIAKVQLAGYSQSGDNSNKYKLLKVIFENEKTKQEISFLLISHCGATFVDGGAQS